MVRKSLAEIPQQRSRRNQWVQSEPKICRDKQRQLVLATRRSASKSETATTKKRQQQRIPRASGNHPAAARGTGILAGAVHRTKIYPIAYNKWIREQVAGSLGLRDLYRELPPILSIRNIESDEMMRNADAFEESSEEMGAALAPAIRAVSKCRCRSTSRRGAAARL